MRKILLLLLMMSIGIVSSANLQAVKSDSINAYIRNGDFQLFDGANMTTYGFASPYSFSWTRGGAGAVDISQPCGVNQTGVGICNATWCGTIGHSSECLQIGRQGSTGPNNFMMSNEFQWQSGTDTNISFDFIPLNQPCLAGSPQSICISLYPYPYLSPTYDVCHSISSYFTSGVSTTPVNYEINISSFLTDGTYYKVLLWSNIQGLKNCQMFTLDNFGLGNSNLIFTLLNGKCTSYFINSTHDNNTYSCQTSNIDTTNCQAIGTVYGQTKNWVDSSSFDYLFSGHAFNASGSLFEETFTGFAPPLPNPPIGYPQNEHDYNLAPYFNNSGVFDTCYFTKNATTNASLSRIECNLWVDCGLNMTSRDCSSVCVDGIIYKDGQYNETSGSCANFTSYSQCPFPFCGSTSSCTVPIVQGNYTYPFYALNTTSTLASSVLGFFVSPMGMMFVVMFLIEIGFYYMTNEFFTLILFSVMNFIYGVLGFYPSWVGVIMALFGATIMIYDWQNVRGASNGQPS